ncbi:phosphodiester glycosidase family protein [Sodalinema gerasimenkoae]|uniref:phosphodiester glycosidase family protein n=1 Tax=Sodalinema gerasimenkoae TaxID=2862348 RepID=UPI001359096A|nr:phosphodiester glycosidase family protein [Sodalinema gerasimenkoae]
MTAFIAFTLTTTLLATVSLSTDPPYKFKVIRQEPGLRLYGNGVDWVQELDLSAGVSLQLFDPRHVQDWGEGADDLGNLPQYDTGVSVSIDPQPIQVHWQDLEERWGDRAFSVTNGQFFGSQPLQLAFPLKADGIIYSGGYAGLGEYPGEKKMLMIQGQQAQILPFPEVGYPENPLFSPIPNLLVGLDEWADKGIKRAVGRTFIGVGDRNQDGTSETLWIFNSPAATQLRAARVLRALGAQEIMMLDGGGSTQLVVQGIERLRSRDRTPRAIPHSLGVILPRPSTPDGPAETPGPPPEESGL